MVYKQPCFVLGICTGICLEENKCGTADSAHIAKGFGKVFGKSGLSRAEWPNEGKYFTAGNGLCNGLG